MNTINDEFIERLKNHDILPELRGDVAVQLLLAAILEALELGNEQRAEMLAMVEEDES